MEFVLRLIATMAGLWVSIRLVPSLEIAETASMTESLLVLAAIALVFTVVNSLVKPLVSFLAFPLYVLTFGLFAIVVNSVPSFSVPRMLFWTMTTLSTSPSVTFSVKSL